jgi:tripartite-type tricarboxylate transporter receptor subunit TctC
MLDRATLGLAFALAMLTAAPVVRAQSADEWKPDRAVTVIIPFTAGGASDLVIRAIQNDLARFYGNSIVVKNIAGAGGSIAVTEFIRAKNDGLTVLASTPGPTLYQPNLRPVGYSMDSMISVCQLYSEPVMLMAKPDAPYNSVKELAEAAKAQPGRITMATTGIGGVAYVAIAEWEGQLGAKFLNVPYKGSMDAINGLRVGDALYFPDQINLVKQYGMKPIAVMGEERTSDFPDVPTFREQGWDIMAPIHLGLFLQAGTPGHIVTRLERSCRQTLESPDSRTAMQRMAVPPRFLDSKAYDAFNRAYYARVAKVVKENNIKAE